MNSVYGDVHGISVQSEVIHGGIHQHAPRPSPTSLRSLPPLPPAFTGRAAELELIHEGLHSSGQGESGERQVVATVTGMGGTGKSALVTVAAHQALEQRRFEGAMWVNLHGYSQDRQPVDAAHALDTLLRSLGVDVADLPVDAEEKSQLYRSRLDSVSRELGGPLLVIADNAAEVAQVAPLVPGPGGNRLLVTSRRTLASSALQGARQVSLGNLASEESAALLRSILASADPDDPRLSDEGITTLAELCCGLPLALKITVGQMIRSRRLTPTKLAERLADSIRVDRLKDEEHVLTRVFDLSYRDLTREQARVFVLLGMAPGPSISLRVAQALCDTEDEETLLETVDSLVCAHLLSHHPERDRWSMHDLLTDYVWSRGEWTKGEFEGREGPEEALQGLLTFYSYGVAEANNLLWPGELWTPAGVSLLKSAEAALAWVEGEQDVLVNSVFLAERLGHDSGQRLLPLGLARFLSMFRRFDDQVLVAQVARNAFRSDGDLSRELLSLNHLGLALHESRKYQEAVEAHGRARELAVRIGDTLAIATACNNLGTSASDSGETDLAIDALRTATELFAELGALSNEAGAWNNLGSALADNGEDTAATAAYQRSLGLYRRSGHSHGEAQSLGNLARHLSSTNQQAKAETLHHQVLAKFRETGDARSEALEHQALGNTLLRSGRTKEALARFHLAQRTLAALGDLRDEASIWWNIALALGQHGEHKDMAAALQRSEDLSGRAGDQFARATALCYLGEIQRQLKQHDASAESFRASAILGERSGNLEYGAVAWNSLGNMFLAFPDRGDPGDAYARAREMADRAKDTRQGVIARVGLCQILRDSGDISGAWSMISEARAMASGQNQQSITDAVEELWEEAARALGVEGAESSEL